MSGQEILEKLSKEMCDCIELGEYKSVGETEPCFDKMFELNESLIREFYNTNELTDSQVFEFMNKIGAKLSDNCKYIVDNFPTGIIGEKRIKQANVDCNDIKDGEFYYLTQRPDSHIQDTTFVSISKEVYLEKMSNKTTYSRSQIIWTDDCNFDLKFEESNDPFKKERFRKGQIFSYEIIANEKDSFFLEIDWDGQDYQFEIFKIK